MLQVPGNLTRNSLKISLGHTVSEHATNTHAGSASTDTLDLISSTK